MEPLRKADSLLRAESFERKTKSLPPTRPFRSRAVAPLLLVLDADVHVQLAVDLRRILARRAVLHAHDHRVFAGVPLDEAVLPGEAAQPRERVRLAVEDRDRLATLAVERRGAARFLVGEVDPSIEPMLRACERPGAETRERARRVPHLGRRADERVVLVDGVVRPVGGDHVAVTVEDHLRHDRPAIERPPDERLRPCVERELVVHVHDRGAAVPVGTEPVRDTDHLVLLRRVARLGNSVADRQQRLGRIPAGDPYGIRLHIGLERGGGHSGGDECRSSDRRKDEFRTHLSPPFRSLRRTGVDPHGRDPARGRRRGERPASVWLPSAFDEQSRQPYVPIVRRVALVVALAAACAAAPASARQHAPPDADAATFCLGTGAEWRRGTARVTYVITCSRGVTCAFAKPWVRRLSGRPASRSGQALAGPPGYQCRVTIPFGGKAAGGACGRSGGRGFGWVPRF